MGNDAWTENGQYDDWGNPVSPVPAEVEINSATGWTSTVGNKDWSEYNQITIKVYCATDGVITIEWTSTANFYISEFVFWYVSVLR